MSLRHWRQMLRFMPFFSPEFTQVKNVLNRSLPIEVPGTAKIGSYSLRYSTIPQDSEETSGIDDILSFIKSTFNDHEGPQHCWLNRIDGDNDFLKKDGTFIVLAGQIIGNSERRGCDPATLYQKVKVLHQRFPHLSVLGFQPGCSTSSITGVHPLQLIMKEYIAFPILLSTKNFFEIEDGTCYILCKDFRSPLVFHEESSDLGVLIKAVEELNTQDDKNSSVLLKSPWVKQDQSLKEPSLCSSIQNLLLHFPGCISADDIGERLFLSDTNHHRIIIFTGNGEILDSIGSSPGFEDGDFESAKMARPAASFYCEDEDCLYIVDSENHAIRRADLERRVLETLYPVCDAGKGNSSSIWTWIMEKLGFDSEDSIVKPEEFDSQSLLFPWHMLMSDDSNTIIIANCSFDTLWVMDLASGEIKETITGFPTILEYCGELITEKLSVLKQMPCDWLQQQTDACSKLEEYPYAGLISSLATFQNHVVMCDTVGQRVLKLSRESGVVSHYQFSNFGILGLPYWLHIPLERVNAATRRQSIAQTHQLHCTDLFPGRLDMHLSIDIPLDIELVEPLNESCIWRQARGAATVYTGTEGVVGSSEKVGTAQQWYDELDNLAFSSSQSELYVEDNDAVSDVSANLDSNATSNEAVCIDCSVNTSPGDSEIIIYAPLYLRLRSTTIKEESRGRYAAKIADFLNPDGGKARDLCAEFLLKGNSDLSDLIFLKPLHIRIRLSCLIPPKAVNNSKEVVVTNSSIRLSGSLSSPSLLVCHQSVL